MAEFTHEDMKGSRFERVDLTGSEFRSVDLGQARFRGVDFRDVVMTGVEMCDVRISGEFKNLVLNGSTWRPSSRLSSTGVIPSGRRCAPPTRLASARLGTSSNGSGPARSSEPAASTPSSCTSPWTASGRSSRP
jgi:Pentapeptide repeats (9 copies)